MDQKAFFTRHLPILLIVGVAGFYFGSQGSPSPIQFVRINPGHNPPVPADLLKVLNDANEDMNQLLREKPPIHAQKKGKITDGGSIYYQNSDYELWDYRKLNSVNDTFLVMRGVGVRFTRKGKVSSLPWNDASYTWLETVNLAKPNSP